MILSVTWNDPRRIYWLLFSYPLIILKRNTYLFLSLQVIYLKKDSNWSGEKWYCLWQEMTWEGYIGYILVTEVLFLKERPITFFTVYIPIERF